MTAADSRSGAVRSAAATQGRRGAVACSAAAMQARIATGLAAALVLALAACAPAPVPATQPTTPAQLRFLGEAHLPSGRVDGMDVGGLSGIDYDATRDRWVVISDDRSRRDPARFFTARISWNDATGLDVKLDAATALRRRDGRPFTPGSIDPESIRMTPAHDGVLVSSEGLRATRPRRSLIDPFIREFGLDGQERRRFEMPANFAVAERAGPRSNSVLEGIAVTPDGKSLWASLEGPMLQDDDVPTLTRGAWLRFTRFDMASGKPVRQIVYELSPLPARGWFGMSGGDYFPDIGVSEIAALDDHRLIVLERSFTFGPGFVSRLFEIDTRGATDVLALQSLEGATFTPATKRLLLDLTKLPVAAENVEGLAIGPRVKHVDGSPGGRLVVIVADDNFSPFLQNQFLALELPD